MLGAGKAGAFFASTAAGGGEAGSSGAVSRGEMVGAEAVRPAGARARSEVLGTAKAQQRWRPGRDDEGACGGVFWLRRSLAC